MPSNSNTKVSIPIDILPSFSSLSLGSIQSDNVEIKELDTLGPFIKHSYQGKIGWSPFTNGIKTSLKLKTHRLWKIKYSNLPIYEGPSAHHNQIGHLSYGTVIEEIDSVHEFILHSKGWSRFCCTISNEQVYMAERTLKPKNEHSTIQRAWMVTYAGGLNVRAGKIKKINKFILITSNCILNDIYI
jgi:hypothetical protein